VLAPLTPVVLPVVGRGVQTHDVGCGRVVEELSDLVVRVGVGLLRARGPGCRTLGGKRREPVGGGVAERIAPLDVHLGVVPASVAGITPEAHGPVQGTRLVAGPVPGYHHVDDGFQCGVQQGGDQRVEPMMPRRVDLAHRFAN
jgi:hypothetical protein